MAANSEHRQEQNYQVIQEQIIRKRKPKWKKRMAIVVSVIGLGVLFGLVARYVFLVSDELLIKLFGLEVEKKQEVHLSHTATKIPTQVPTPLLKQEITQTPTPSVQPTPTIMIQMTPSQKEETEPNILKEYMAFYEEVNILAEKTKKAFVTVTAIESGIDWFDATYETRKSTSGIILGCNGVEILILAHLEDIKNAEILEVSFANGVVGEGTICSYDSDFAFAIVAVKLEHFNDKQKAELVFAKIAEQSPKSGTPVLFLGMLHDQKEAIEVGMITNAEGVVSIVDGELFYYTTNIVKYPYANGFFVDLEGKLLGMVTSELTVDMSVLTAVSVVKAQEVLNVLLNNSYRVYCGIKLSEIPKHVLEQLGLEHGVYIIEVEHGSPAFTAGLKSGDIIKSINGEVLHSVSAFEEVLTKYQLEETLDMTIVRNSKTELKEQEILVIPEKK